MSVSPHTIILASRSQRRKALLEEAGYRVGTMATLVDDSELRRRPGRCCRVHSPQRTVMLLAYYKARHVWHRLRHETDQSSPHGIERHAKTIVVGADTVCVHHDELLGKPRDADEAREMLMSLRNAEHITMTGVCVIAGLTKSTRYLLVDEAKVIIGTLSDRLIDEYVRSEQWRGKAGGYNLSEVIAAGWAVHCEGDPTTVMGLPMRLLLPILAELFERNA